MVTASQAVKMYELLNKYFKNTEDSKTVVASIEDIIDNKFNTEKDRLATKQDIFALQAATKHDLSALQAATKHDFFCLKEEVLALQARMEQGFKDQLRWLIALMVGLSSLGIAVLKLT